ncbi:SycD/LcrH family type III secretion system chaperone [Peristeroidobacter soli]|uniref:SycD/LcrH family type III secretion system chaperone n=1 Tax=Peristeroidobacter soli TaxID=2497877 RepID=UPI00101C8A92|nr:SycD/LcrH family type III secretion system chaperone [Peristeroidobacter soli]
MTQDTRDINDLLQEVADFMFAGGTVADLYGLKPEELEPMYALGYSLYNQARWSEALKIFSFLTYHSHLEQRFHVGRGACLQMLKQHQAALNAYGLAYLLDASDPSVCLHIAECLIALGKKEDARGVLEAVADMTQGDAASAEVGKRGAALAALIGH